MKERICKLADEKQQYLNSISDRIWDSPELGYKEFTSAKILKDALVENGFQLEENLAGIPTAFKGIYGSGRPVIGFLGEFDALANLSQQPCIAEKKPITEGAPGHGCGHNSICTTCLGAALVMKQLMEEGKLGGTIIVYGCPAEEQGCGKSFMTREGVFNELDIAIAPHPSDHNDIMGVSALANIQAEFSFTGMAAHAAAMPDRGRSALDAADLMIVGVQFLREHIIQEARLHHAYLDAGGSSPNVVQASAKLLFYIRAPKSSQVREIFERVKKVARGAAMMTDTQVEINVKSAMVELLNNDVLGNLAAECWREIGPCRFSDEAKTLAKAMAPAVGNDSADLLDEGTPAYKRVPVAMPGSTDVGDVSFVAPTVMMMYAAATRGTPGHSWQMVSQGRSALTHEGNNQIVKVMALLGMKLLQDPELVKKAKAEFDATGLKYECLIPDEVKPEL